MTWLSAGEQRAAEALAAIGYSNPFKPERMDLERQALGAAFVSYDLVINKPLETDLTRVFPNIAGMRDRAEELALKMRKALLAGEPVNEEKARLYENVVLYLLYSRYNASTLDGFASRSFQAACLKSQKQAWKTFLTDHQDFLELPDCVLPLQYDRARIFATYYQIQRAFRNIFAHLLGRSPSIASLRADVWDSIFTRDIRRYARALHSCMQDVPTLIQGPSGTGKELVAQAIGRSRFIPFDPSKGFAPQADGEFVAINLSALAPSLIESELFGHCKGAFADAYRDRTGFLGESTSHTCVFLDEIGEVDLSIQVKLLRVLQSRTFHRVGETQERIFHGKIIAATNRNLQDEIAQGRFREDFYYRLCADLIHTPSLRQQLAEAPEDLEMLVSLMNREMLKDAPEESDRLTREVVDWIRQHLGEDYDWPGNFRELGQCIRNVMIRGCYRPASRSATEAPAKPRQQLGEAVAQAELSLAEVIQHYASLVYALEGTYEAAGQRLGVNWRTVKDHLSEDLVQRYQDMS